MHTFPDLLDAHGINSFYGAMYERIFAPIRATAANVAEIGCGSGALTHTLREYFTAAEVTGIDIDVGQVLDEWRRDDIRYLNVDARLEGLSYLMGKLRSYDVVIDDTNVGATDHVRFFANLGPYISPGGYYIIEAHDCQDNINEYMIVATNCGLDIVGFDSNIAVFRMGGGGV